MTELWLRAKRTYSGRERHGRTPNASGAKRPDSGRERHGRTNREFSSIWRHPFFASFAFTMRRTCNAALSNTLEGISSTRPAFCHILDDASVSPVLFYSISWNGRVSADSHVLKVRASVVRDCHCNLGAKPCLN